MDNKEKIISELAEKIAEVERNVDSFLTLTNSIQKCYEAEGRKDEKALVEITAIVMDEMKCKLVEILLLIDNIEN